MSTLLAMVLVAAAGNAVIVKPVANMYSRAAEDADVVSQAIYGANVAIVEQQAGWARIRTADDYTGWVPEGSIRTGAPYGGSGRVAEVRSMFAHIYREPDVTKHQPLITVPFEARLEVAAEPPGNQRWIEVKLPDGRSGWVQRGDVEFDSRPVSIPQSIELARRFLGLPYTWGGTSSYGYDCSGFTQMLLRRRGVLMPRDAGPQAKWDGLVPVERDQLQPGDLLYFGSNGGRITHTGMYIGEGKFIHATTHERPVVQISELADPHWTALLVASRRAK
ncbi:MAG TPA: NlpC/P60 family protein [Bryobacteraceae bacterium]|nr:NlpC/P60 family protein [Bryobacteraceae bacterium]